MRLQSCWRLNIGCRQHQSPTKFSRSDAVPLYKSILVLFMAVFNKQRISTD